MSHEDNSLEMLRKAIPKGITDNETQRALIAAAQAGDTKARDKLLMGSIGLVVQIVTRYRDAAHEIGLEMADLVTAGLYGLPGPRRTGMIRAIEKFDLGRGLRLSTYARYWIIDAAQQLLRRSTPVRGELHGRRRVQCDPLPDVTAEADTHDPGEGLDTARAAAAAKGAVKKLEPLQQKVIGLAYGPRCLSTNEIAVALKLPRAAVREIEAAALERLRELMSTAA